MKILGFGVDRSGHLLFPPVEESEALQSLRAALGRNGPSLQAQTRLNTRGATFRGEIQRRLRDPGDPREAGWSFMVAAGDPRRAQIIEIMKLLAEHRGMADPASPFLFDVDPGDESRWGEWLQDHYWALGMEGKKVPQYVLLVGTPRSLPFRFHSLLDTVASVGRVEADTPEALHTYVTKLVRLETAAHPVVKREAIVFAPDGGHPDPTYYSHRYMAAPVARRVQDKHHLQVTFLEERDATKAHLIEVLRAGNPALVYTASHGLGLVGESLGEQKRLNGSICCQSHQLTIDDLFGAEDVPTDRPFLEGAVFFQFACFGMGTPRQSDYAHWLSGVPQTYADEDFVAALPKKLLAHPRGPIAFVGHIDTAFLDGFTDPDAPDILATWHERMAPFVTAIEDFLTADPAAMAMQTMNDRYSTLNAILADTYDRDCRHSIAWTPELSKKLLDTWILRSDAQNYMVFGDPAAALRIPDR